MAVHQPGTLPIRPSRTLALLLALPHIAALALLWPLQLPLMAKLMLTIAVALSVANLLWRQILRPRAIVALRLGSDGRFDVLRGEDTLEPARIDSQSAVLPGLILLRLHTSAGREMLLLPVDALGPTAHRSLRLWLRWYAKLK